MKVSLFISNTIDPQPHQRSIRRSICWLWRRFSKSDRFIDWVRWAGEQSLVNRIIKCIYNFQPIIRSALHRLIQRLIISSKHQNNCVSSSLTSSNDVNFGSWVLLTDWEHLLWRRINSTNQTGGQSTVTLSSTFLTSSIFFGLFCTKAKKGDVNVKCKTLHIGSNDQTEFIFLAQLIQLVVGSITF